MATTDIGRAVPLFRGEYDPAQTYELNDIVSLNGSLYWHYSHEVTTNVAPQATSTWKIVLSLTEAEAYIARAESAAEEAESAKDDAVTAKTAAETASTTATGASEAATAAKDDAVTARNAAQTAETGAVEAKNAAVSAKEAAQSAASSAGTSATNASNSAGTAEYYAENAETAAETATTKASEASASATTASSAATTATEAKNTAVSSASTATTKAGEASTSATSAASSAAAAQAVKDSIPEDYSELSEDVSELKTQLNTFEENTFEITTPIDYGALITASDCAPASSSYAANLIFTDVEDGISMAKDSRVNMVAYIWFNDLPPASAAQPVTYDFTLTIDDSTGIDAIYFYDGYTQVGSYAGGTITKDGNTYKITYTYPNQSKIRWQLGILYSWQGTKTFSVSGLEANFESKYKIIPSTVEWLLNQRDGIEYNDKNPVKINKIINSASWAQGACCVNNKWIGFSASADDHSDNGRIFVGEFPININTATRVNHNLGHSASADYNETSDTIIVANGTPGTVNPEISLIKNASAFAASPTDISYSDTVNIAFNGLSGANNGCVACFAENYNTIFLCTADATTSLEAETKRYIYKILLGTGTADLTVLYPNSSFGTYTAAGDYEYNGTAHIIGMYEVYIKGEFQGLKCDGNMLLFPVDFKYENTLSGWIIGVKFTDDGATIGKIRKINIAMPNGEAYIDEVEDIIKYGEEWYVAANLRESALGSVIYRTLKFVM